MPTLLARAIAAITRCRVCSIGQVNEFGGTYYCTNSCIYR